MAKATQLTTAEKNIEKVIAQIAESKADDAAKELITDGLVGVQCLLQTIDQISNPGNPPADDSAWGKVCALGANRRKLSLLLAGSEAAKEAF